MESVLVEIEIPDGWELAEAAIRAPSEGDYWYSIERGIVYAQCRNELPPAFVSPICNTSDAKVIVRPTWEWPRWLTAPWIAMDKCGAWRAYTDEPYIDFDSDVVFRGQQGGGSAYLATSLLDFTPPLCVDWRNSKLKNPNL
jgi:hypothetical protein